MDSSCAHWIDEFVACPTSGGEEEDWQLLDNSTAICACECSAEVDAGVSCGAAVWSRETTDDDLRAGAVAGAVAGELLDFSPPPVSRPHIPKVAGTRGWRAWLIKNGFMPVLV